MKLVLLLGVLFASLPVSAFNAIERYQNQLQGHIKKGDTLIVKDEKFLNPAYDWQKIHNWSVNNVITFGLYRDSAAVLSKAFHCEVDLKVEYWPRPDQAEPIVEDHIKLKINYDPAAGVPYQDAALYNFQNGYRVRITVNDITSAELGSDLPAAFRINSQVIVERSYELNAKAKLMPHVIMPVSANTGGNMRMAAIQPGGQDENSSEISLVWNKIEGVEEYDLEWTFIDEKSENGRYLGTPEAVINAEVLNKMFRNNSTRVTVQREEYKISLVHYSKYLILRMREVVYESNGIRHEYPWQYELENADNTTGPSVIALENEWHQKNLNWQYDAVYAEEGKKKEVVNYFDGTLRNRQTVTVNNADNKAVVKETIYDEFGRPLASILPSPENESVLKYYGSLHKDANGNDYSFRNIYGDAGACIGTPAPLATTAGAGRYYSPNNLFKGLSTENKYIPDAEGYPFAVTRYTPDNTGRVSVEGGVGKLFQPGVDQTVSKATRHYYAAPQSWELNRMFGNDIGFADHYLKNMTIDGNGQISITYLDAEGRTIATALAGETPVNVDPLPSKPAPKEVTAVILEPTQFRFDESKLKISATATHTQTVPGPVKLHYDIDKLIKTYADNGVTICSNCYYEMDIRITDDCNRLLYKTDDPLPIGSATGDCNNVGAARGDIDANFDLVGVYYVNFELRLTEDALKSYTKDFIEKNTNLRSDWSFVNDALLGKDFLSCFNDCATCKESLGDLTTFSSRIKAQLKANSVNVDANDQEITSWINGLYANLASECAALRASCVASPCTELENVLKQDVSPGGQFALFDATGSPLEADINVIALHWREQGRFPILEPTDPLYIDEKIELPDGKITSPYDKDFTLAMLVSYWKPEWATKFVTLHPEYCALEFCMANAANMQWDERVKTLGETIADISEAVPGAVYDKGDLYWLVNKDPFFLPGGSGYGYRNEFIADLTDYTRTQPYLQQAGLPAKKLTEFVDYQLYCSDKNGSTNTTPSADNWANCTPDLNCRIPDLEWTTYRDKYFEIKEKYYTDLRNTPQYCGSKCAVGTPVSYPGTPCTGCRQSLASGPVFQCTPDLESKFIVIVYGGSGATPSITVEYNGIPLDQGMSISGLLYHDNISVPFMVTSSEKFFTYNVSGPIESTRISILQCVDKPYNPCNAAYATKVSRANNFSYETPDVSTDPSELTEIVAEQVAAQVASNCEAQADNWMQQLEKCLTGYNDTQKNLVRAKLIEVCKLGGDLNHPMGASTLPAGKATAEGYRSFDDVITGVLNVPATSILCNSYLLDAPAPYETKQQLTSTTISSTNVAVCTKLTTLLNEYTAAGGQGGFYNYLKTKFGDAMDITEPELQMLQKGCTNCRYLLAKPVELPVFMDADVKGCITSTEYATGKTELTTRMGASFNPTVENYETIFVNYLNSRFGFTLSYGAYQAYEEELTKNAQALLCNSPVYSSVPPDPYKCMMDVLEDAAIAGRTSYLLYIEEIERQFRKDYIAYCGANRPKVLLTTLQQIYHYTLYYYDQAGNLVRTVPPEGVHLLDDGLSGQVDMVRNSVPVTCSYNGGEEPANISEAYQKLNTLFTTTNYQSMELWISSPNGGQVTATLPGKNIMFNACLSGQFLNFDVYNIVPSSDGKDADIILTGHTVADMRPMLPLQQWTHVVIQGPGLNRGGLSVYVNGQRCAAGPLSEITPCLWEMATASAGVTVPENLTSLKHLRLYNRLLTADEIAANAKESCMDISPAYAAALQPPVRTYWGRFNIPNPGAPGTIDGSTTETRYTAVFPAHTLATSYAYHSLNGIEIQRTPDAGGTRFWYDKLGRVVASQNAEQSISSNGDLNNRYSFTRYDALGRVILTGEKTGVNGGFNPLQKPFLNETEVADFQRVGSNRQTITTYYDVPPAGLASSVTDEMTNLRKRVTAITYTDKAGGNVDFATYYGYDQIGNTKVVMHDNLGLGLKKIEYQYDLISGKVNKVRYQKGQKDQFFYGYEYDPEDRLTKVVTGVQAVTTGGWEILNPHTDAAYRYYLHGPLARYELGNDKLVQGIDYVYTLQGRLKGVNGNYLLANRDVGQDGVSGTRSNIARDAFAYTLDYFGNDYKPIDASANAFPLVWTARQPTEIGRDLYNGNVARTTVALKRIENTAGYSYRYDQENRLKNMRQHLLTAGLSGWSLNSAREEFKENLTYDGNGNILTYLRNGGNATKGLGMDNITYGYNKDAAGNLVNNRLTQVQDNEANSQYGVDIKTGVTQYRYDRIGNLLGEDQERVKITNVSWSASGKLMGVNEVDLDNSANSITLTYRYDPQGNRVYKESVSSSGTAKNWYVRDAQGNTLAIYELKNGKIYWKEQQLYGNSRLGTWNVDIDLSTETSGVKWDTKGTKNFELTNHLGNVLVVISDKVVDSVINGKVDHYEAEIVSSHDYYPFGMMQPDRHWELGRYRYGFNGKENDNEVKGEGNQQDYGLRVYDPRLGKFLSVDPLGKNFPWNSSYAFAENKPIWGIDLDGAEVWVLGVTEFVEGTGGIATEVGTIGRTSVSTGVSSAAAWGAKVGPASTAETIATGTTGTGWGGWGTLISSIRGIPRLGPMVKPLDQSIIGTGQQQPATSPQPNANPARQHDPKKAPVKSDEDEEKPFYIYETGSTDKIRSGMVKPSAGVLPYFGITRDAFEKNKSVKGRYASTHERVTNYSSYKGILGQAPESIAYGVESALIALNTYGENFETKVLLNQHSSADVQKTTRIDNKMFSRKDAVSIAAGIVWLRLHFGADWKAQFLHKENEKGDKNK